MSDASYDLVVIGSGPGGYVCAIRAAQLGLKVACVEKDPTLGGTCLNVGCIPSKALLESSERYEMAQHDMAVHGVQVGSVSLDLNTMLARKTDIVTKLTGGIEHLFKKNKVVWEQGLGTILGAGQVQVTHGSAKRVLAAKNIVIATGSSPFELPGVPFDGERVVSSTEALSFSAVPKHLILVGAGVVGLELGSVWRRLGAKVTVVEYLDRILPGLDKEVAKEARKLLKRQGMEFILKARVTGAKTTAKSVTVTYEDKDGTRHDLKGDRALVAIGRRAHTDGLGCAEAGVELDDRGRVVIDTSFQSSVPGIYAIGDVVRGPMLAHKAEDEGIAVAEILATGRGHVEYDAIPSVVYTHPEIAAVGKTEEELKAAGVDYKKGKFRYTANGRAMALGEKDGFVKFLADAKTDRILGCHIIGARAGDMIAEIAIAVEFKASTEDIARSVHAHPTLAEIVREAALDVDRRALHH
jgi:dihydrolipoamide dehydrogenase